MLCTVKSLSKIFITDYIERFVMFGKLHLEMDINRIFVFQSGVMFVLMNI